MYSKTLKEAQPSVLAALTRSFQDLEKAEDLFQEASLRALQTWPKQGLPDNPVSWLIRVGRNAGLDLGRKEARLSILDSDVSDAGRAADDIAEDMDHQAYGDDMLRLLFICCHPVLSKAQQIALALKIVAGLSVSEIAGAFLVKVRTMEQRITRAKKQIASESIPFDIPDEEEKGRRIHAVSTVIYLLFNEGYSASGGVAHIRATLCDEAIRLCRILTQICPGHAESLGLLALCLLQDSRRSARLDDSGDIVLLEEQDRSLWDVDRINDGTTVLQNALQLKQPGPYQIQAAIAAVHASVPSAEQTDWEEICRLYEILEGINPTPVVRLNRSIAISKVNGFAAALQLLETVGEELKDYFHFHGARAGLLAKLEKYGEAQVAFERAMTLARTPAEKTHLKLQMEKFEKK